MKPDLLMIEPLTRDAEAALDTAYRVHRLFQAGDPARMIDEIGRSVRAVVTGGAHGIAGREPLTPVV